MCINLNNKQHCRGLQQHQAETQTINKIVFNITRHNLMSCHESAHKNNNICILVTDAIADDTVRYQYVKKKGYVRLHTNKGDLNLELHCDKVITHIHTNTTKNINSLTKPLGKNDNKVSKTLPGP